MKVLITGVCGFVGSSLALELKQRLSSLEVVGLDNLSRPGSEVNRSKLKTHNVTCLHRDLRNPSDLENLPKTDWVIDAAANPSVLAGVNTQTSSRQLMEHNLIGTLHLLEYCKRHSAGLILLSTSRVYSQEHLSVLPIEARDSVFVPKFATAKIPGLSEHGVAESFPTQPPLSLYGAAKLASEIVALEYSLAFDLPVYINRCGVMAGAGQFGKPDQGIFSFWIHSWCRKRPLAYIGFDGTGRQVRDCLHPNDLAGLLCQQMREPKKSSEPLNVSGGAASGISLAQLSDWCAKRFGPHQVAQDLRPRRFDVPWLILDSTRATSLWNWRPQMHVEQILEEIALHAEQHPEWLELSSET